MSKAEELKKKMTNNAAAFTPRQSVTVNPIPETPTSEKPETTPKPKPQTTKKPAKKEQQELATLFAKIPKEDKRWLDHRRVDTGKELGEIVAEAVQLLKKQDS